jgi:hypothetical protein
MRTEWSPEQGPDIFFRPTIKVTAYHCITKEDKLYLLPDDNHEASLLRMVSAGDTDLEVVKDVEISQYPVVSGSPEKISQLQIKLTEFEYRNNVNFPGCDDEKPIDSE